MILSISATLQLDQWNAPTPTVWTVAIMDPPWQPLESWSTPKLQQKSQSDTGTHKLYWHATHLQSKLPRQHLKDL